MITVFSVMIRVLSVMIRVFSVMITDLLSVTISPSKHHIHSKKLLENPDRAVTKHLLQCFMVYTEINPAQNKRSINETKSYRSSLFIEEPPL